MNFDPNHLLGSLATFGLVLWIIYRRFRRLFGRQELRPKRMKFRIVILSIFGVLLLVPTLFSQKLALALIVGLGVGVSLGVWGAKHTRFEVVDGKTYYIPHTYTGMVVSALFLGRLIYRFAMASHSFLMPVLTINSAEPSASDFSGLSSFGGMPGNPFTFCVFFMLVGYYVYYYNYVLYESKHLKPGDYEKPRAPDAPGGNVS